MVWNRDPDALALPCRCPAATASTSAPSRRPASPSVFDGAIVLECPSPDRTGIEEHLAALPLHQRRPPPRQPALRRRQLGRLRGAGGRRDGRSAWRRRSSVAIDPETAIGALPLPWSTDTGGFRFSNATPAAFEAAARAGARGGAARAGVAVALREPAARGRSRLLGEMLADPRSSTPAAASPPPRLTPAMFARAGAAPGDTEGLIDYPRSIAGVEAVALVRQRDGRHASRSRCAAAARSTSRRSPGSHGGGGHRNAAGCSQATEATRSCRRS